MMSKRLSVREMILLSILIVLLINLLYYVAVLEPTASAMSAANAELDSISDLIVIEQAKAEQIQTMRKALEELNASTEESAVTPLFDNFENLLEELNRVLANAENYKLNFLNPVTDNGVAKRELQLVFNADSYYTAREILKELYSGPYRCDITSFKIASVDGTVSNITASSVAVTLSMLYYEINK